MNNSNRNNDVKLPFTRKPQLVLFILTVCCIGSMGYYYIRKENIASVTQVVGAVTVPVQKGINKLGSIFFQFDQRRLTLEEAQEQIASLEAENEELKEQMVSYDQKIQEYQNMRKLLELKNTYGDYTTVGASVIFADTSGNWFSTFTIDKGTDDGLALGMNVLAEGGLAGYISDIASGHAVVTTIINDKTNVSAMQSTTGDGCVVAGDLTYIKKYGLLKLQYMDTDFDISRDNVIVTSRISDRYLPGLVIGYAQNVTVDSNGLAASGYLKPAVDFQHVSNVLVITTQKQTADGNGDGE